MPGFHHSVAVLPLPFRRSAVVKFRCSVKKYVRKFRSVTAVNSKRIRSGNSNGVYGNGNGNGRTATEWWKPGISPVYVKNQDAPCPILLSLFIVGEKHTAFMQYCNGSKRHPRFANRRGSFGAHLTLVLAITKICIHHIKVAIQTKKYKQTAQK